MSAYAPAVTFVIDDTPTKRYGPHVEGAGWVGRIEAERDGRDYLVGDAFSVADLDTTKNVCDNLADFVNSNMFFIKEEKKRR